MKAAVPRRFAPHRRDQPSHSLRSRQVLRARHDSRGNAGSPCTTASGLPGTIVVWTDSSGVVTSWCQYAPPSEALPDLVLNEIDYDQVGADAGGFVELYNAGLGPADLEGLALVFVDGANGSEYLRRPLSGALAAGAYRVVRVDAQNGSPDGVALYDTRYEGVIDALSYEGAIERAFIGAVRAHARRGNGAAGSRGRLEHGHRLARADPERQRHGRRRDRLGVHDHGHAGAANVPGGPSAAPSPACSRGPLRRPWPSASCSSAWSRLSSRRSRWASSRCSFVVARPALGRRACRPRVPPARRSRARSGGRSPRSGTARRGPRRRRTSRRARPTTPRAGARASPASRARARRRAGARAAGAWSYAGLRRRPRGSAASRGAPRRRACSRASTCRRRRSRAGRSSGPAARCARTSSSPSPVRLEIACTGTPNAIASTSSTRSAKSGQRSVFVRTITGCAPLSHAIVM